MASLAIEDEEVLDLLERDASWTDVLDQEDAKFEGHRSNLHRKVQQYDDDDVWDPWHEDVSCRNSHSCHPSNFELETKLNLTHFSFFLPFFDLRSLHPTFSLVTREV